MDMEDFLPGIPGRVKDDPVAAFSNPFLPGEIPGPEENLPEQGFGSVGGFVEGGEMVLGDDQDVDRSFGPDVLEGEEALVLEKNIRRELPADDAAEKAVNGGRRGHAGTLSIEAPSPRSFSSILS